MAVTTQNSTQITNMEASPPTHLQPYDRAARVRFAFFNFTQVVAGDANSLMNLVKLPPGRHRILCALSHIKFSAFGTGRTLDVGYVASVDVDGGAISASIDTVSDGIDVSAAGKTLLGTGTNGLSAILLAAARDEVKIQAKVLGGTIPDAATLTGWIAYATD
jgi:hypothetical protein